MPPVAAALGGLASMAAPVAGAVGAGAGALGSALGTGAGLLGSGLGALGSGLGAGAGLAASALGKPVGQILGEIGLDYYKQQEQKKAQQDALNSKLLAQRKQDLEQLLGAKTPNIADIYARSAPYATDPLDLYRQWIARQGGYNE